MIAFPLEKHPGQSTRWGCCRGKGAAALGLASLSSKASSPSTSEVVSRILKTLGSSGFPDSKTGVSACHWAQEEYTSSLGSSQSGCTPENRLQAPASWPLEPTLFCSCLSRCGKWNQAPRMKGKAKTVCETNGSVCEDKLCKC